MIVEIILNLLNNQFWVFREEIPIRWLNQKFPLKLISSSVEILNRMFIKLDHGLKRSCDEELRQCAEIHHQENCQELDITCEEDTLKNIIDKIPEQPVSLNSCHKSNFHEDGNTKEINNKQERRTPNLNIHCRSDLLKVFLSIPQNSDSLNFYQRNLETKLEMAKLFALTIDQCQRNISYIRQNLENCYNHSEKQYLINELEQQQNVYRKALTDLKEVQKETLHLESGMKKAEIETENKFRCWLEKYNSELHPQVLITGEQCYKTHTNCSFTNSARLSTTGHPSLQNQSENCTCYSSPNYCRNSCNTSGKSTPCCVDRLNHVGTSRMYNDHALLPEERNVGCVSRSCTICSNIMEKCDKPNINHYNNVFRETDGNYHVSQLCSSNCSCGSIEIGNGFENAPSKCGFYSEKKNKCHQLVTPLHILENNDNHVSAQAIGNCSCILPQRNMFIEPKNNHICEEEYYTQQNSVLNVSNDICVGEEDNCYQNESLRFISSGCNISYPPINEVASSEFMKNPRIIRRDCECTNEVTKEVMPHFYLSNEVDEEHENVTDIEENKESKFCSEIVQPSNLVTANSPSDYFEKTDTNEFREFMKSVSLSGDADVDKEIFCFYRSKFC